MSNELAVKRSELEFEIKSFIVLIGSTNAGKSYFVKNHLVPGLLAEMPEANIHVVSSDAYRQELLGKEYHKYADEMLHASEAAFRLMEAKAKYASSFPINADFVIFDARNLSKETRQTYIDIARANGYSLQAVIFDYKKTEDYFKFTDFNEEGLDTFKLKKSVHADIKRLRKEVYGEVAKRDYRKSYKVKSTDFADYSVKVKGYEEYRRQILPVGPRYHIIGDVHNCYEELVALIDKLGYSSQDGLLNMPDWAKIVLVGDWCDGGPDFEKTLNFIYDNRQHFILVKGNHENFNYKFHKGEFKESDLPEKSFMESYFDTTYRLVDEGLKQKFFELVESSVHCLIHRDFFVSHAPCEQKYLGKLHPRALSRQRNFIYPKQETFETEAAYIEGMEKSLAFLVDEARRNFPFRIFGHIRFAEVFRHKNIMGIDTGCADGNKLTAVEIDNLTKKVLVTQVPYREPNADHKLVQIFRDKKKTFDLSTLEPHEKRRLQTLAESKVNFISGTMSPSDKDPGKDALETLDTALAYYKEKGVERVILQPKYMGSRAQIYLYRDLEKSFTVSRNGFRIKKEIPLEAYAAIWDRVKDESESQYAEFMILDAELMPWYFLGEGLIEEQFNVVGQAVKTEMMALKEVGFEEALAELKRKRDESGYEVDKNSMKKPDLIKKYTHPVYCSYSALPLYKHSPIDDHLEAIQVYDRQLELYGSPNVPTHFKPFSLLKTVFTDGTECLDVLEGSNQRHFELLSGGEKSLTISSSPTPEEWEQAQAFYDQYTVREELEGVVVKPADFIFQAGIAPFLKVRNPRYMTIIYGYDYLFTTKHNKLMAQKDIRRKLRTSIEEFTIGVEMLKIPHAEISLDNAHYAEVFAKMVAEEKHEREIDPRL